MVNRANVTVTPRNKGKPTNHTIQGVVTKFISPISGPINPTQTGWKIDKLATANYVYGNCVKQPCRLLAIAK